VLTVHRGVLTGLITQVALLAVLAGTAGLGVAGGLTGLAYGVVVAGLLSRARQRSGAGVLGPADLVTSARSVLVGGTVALVADAFVRPVPVGGLTALAVVALVLDAVDGRVARYTRTESAVGARFDMEVDSILVLALSVYVARTLGPWVLAIGSVHYVLVVARWVLPWLRGPVPPRHWCKVVAAFQGIVLIAVAAGVLPRAVALLALLVVAALLAESFGREVWWLWRSHRVESATAAHREPSGPSVADGEADTRSGRRRSLLPSAATGLAAVVVWAALVLPDRLFRLAPVAFLRIPVEALVLAGLVLLLPVRRIRVVAMVVGLLLGLLTVVRMLDLGFYEVLHRPFNPVNDWRLVPPAVDMLRDSFGPGRADAAVVGAAAVLVVVPAVVTMAVIRICRSAARRRVVVGRTAGSLGVVWLVCVLLGVQLTPGVPVASGGAAELAIDHVRDAAHDLGDLSVFRAQLAADDPWSTVPAEDLLTGLRGKDVIVAFVESYGRVAVQGSSFSPDVRALLDAGTERLTAAGFSSRSAFLTSPTFAGISWLAHATLQSGLWIDTQQRHDQLLSSDRFTLAGAFGRAGWRTVVDVPSNRDPWPEGRAFYGYDEDYDRHDVGYEGPKFSFAAVPDQYTLAAFERMELAPGHAPVMAEIDLVTSHEPWTPLPRMVDWDSVGDGSVYDSMPAEGLAPTAVLGDADQVRALYAESIEYSLTALISFVTTFHERDEDLVLVLVGDHQPASVVTGPDASHDVPITIIASDPAVLAQTAPWGWDDGMLPGPDAPLWRMDAFRDRFLAAFGSTPVPGSSVSAPR
jgi:phosphatidylglycerophosphate synthase